MIATIATGLLVVLTSGIIFASSLPLTLATGLWGNLYALAACGAMIMVFCLHDLLSQGKAVNGIVKLCVILCLPSLIASSEMTWLHALAEQCLLSFKVRLAPGLLVLLLTVVTAGCVLLLVQAQQQKLRLELLRRNAEYDEVSVAFAWQTGITLVMLVLTGLLMALLLAGQNLTLVQHLALSVASKLPPAVTVLTGVALMAITVGAYLVDAS